MDFHNHFNNSAEENMESGMDAGTINESAKKIGTVLESWKAPEFERYEKSLQWYVIALIFLCAMAGYGIYINSPIMSITFILIGIVGYMQTHREPQITTFLVTSRGVLVGKELYPYENIKSFWIFYEPPHTKILSLHTNGNMLPYVHIPLGDKNPLEIRDALLKNTEEIEQEHSIIDTLERVFNL